MLYTAILRKVFRAIHGPLPEPPPDEAETGLVLVADGIGGFDLCVMGMRYASAWAGLRHRVQILDWGHGFCRWYIDLCDVANHKAQAAQVVATVMSYREAHPERPIFLVGKSGGTGIMVRALEDLPENSVEGVILVASALSPRYDLSKALRAVRGEMTSFWSPLDLVLLGAGTSIFKTIDRVRSPGAGMVGFHMPPGADAQQYAKLRQVRWEPRMGWSGHLGGHLGPDNPRFLRTYVIPLLQAATEVDESARPVSSYARPASIT